MRYIFYRAHKYVLYAITELERLIAKTDFTADTMVNKIKDELSEIQKMLHFHAQHEDKFHELLHAKGSTVHHKIDADHHEHDAIFASLNKKLAKILATKEPNERILLGRDFYLAYREFEVENLRHLNEEERILMPELQRLYTDAELKQVEFAVYNIMTADHMKEMIKVLFPHMNPDDHQSFLDEIQEAEPQKFAQLRNLL